MIWHTTIVPLGRLASLLTSIRGRGGTVVNSCPQAGNVSVTWTTCTK